MKKTAIDRTDIKIIKLMAKHSMNVLAVSREMQYHRNSIINRLDVIQRITGCDARTFYGLTKLLALWVDK